MTVDRLRYKVYLSLLASLAVVVHTVEAAIPTPLPGLKFGLANIITLAVIVLFGAGAGMTVTLLRIFVGTVLTGTFLSPSFFLAASGGIASTIVLAAAYRHLGSRFSLIGISVMGAWTHTIVQVTVAYLILVKHFQVFLLLPIFLTFSVFAGLLSGLGTHYLVIHLRDVPGVRKMAEGAST